MLRQRRKGNLRSTAQSCAQASPSEDLYPVTWEDRCPSVLALQIAMLGYGTQQLVTGRVGTIMEIHLEGQNPTVITLLVLFKVKGCPAVDGTPHSEATLPPFKCQFYLSLISLCLSFLFSKMGTIVRER